jgi:hypothetical protein
VETIRDGVEGQSFTTAGGRSFEVYRSTDVDWDDHRINIVVNTVADLADHYGVRIPPIGFGPKGQAMAFHVGGGSQQGVSWDRAQEIAGAEQPGMSAFVISNNATHANVSMGFTKDIMSSTPNPKHNLSTASNQFGRKLYGEGTRALDVDGQITHIAVHEFGHVLFNDARNRGAANEFQPAMEAQLRYLQERPSQIPKSLGLYAIHNIDEFAAETFATQTMGNATHGQDLAGYTGGWMTNSGKDAGVKLAHPRVDILSDRG